MGNDDDARLKHLEAQMGQIQDEVHRIDVRTTSLDIEIRTELSWVKKLIGMAFGVGVGLGGALGSLVTKWLIGA